MKRMSKGFYVITAVGFLALSATACQTTSDVGATQSTETADLAQSQSSRVTAVATEESEKAAAKKVPDAAELLQKMKAVVDAAGLLRDELATQGISDENASDMDIDIIQQLYEELAVSTKSAVEVLKASDVLINSGADKYQIMSFSEAMADTKVSVIRVLENVREGRTMSTIMMSGQDSVLSLLMGVKELEQQYDLIAQQCASGKKKESFVISSQSTKGYTAGEWDNEEEIQLYNAYVNHGNFINGKLQSDLDSYFKHVELQQEFSLSGKHYSNNQIALSEIKNFEDTYRLLNKKSQKDPLDDAFLELYPSVMDMAEQLENIHAYTSMMFYIDDDYADGKVYHQLLWEALGTYTESKEIFISRLNEKDKIKKDESFEELKNGDNEIVYEITAVIYSAQALQQAFIDQGIHDGNILDMDMSVVQPLYDEFAEHTAAVNRLADELEIDKSILDSTFWLRYSMALRGTNSSIIQVLDKVNAGTPLSQTDMMLAKTSGHCSLSSFEIGIADMITAYNSHVSK